jgi:hypothetical protein
MIKAGVGINNSEDSYQAGVSSCQAAIEKLGSDPDLVIVFASVSYDQEKVLQGVRSVSKDAVLAGSSTAGEITTQGPAARHSVAVMALKGEGVQFKGSVAENIGKDPFAAGKKVAETVRKESGDAMSLFMMLPDVLVANGADVVRGVLAGLGEHFPVVGGASGDDFQFKKTYQYFNDKVYTGSLVGIGLSGEFTYGIGVKHGWIPIGMPRTVTKSSGSVVHELDNKPAINIYEEYFGEEQAAELRTQTLAKLAITYPLGMKVEGNDELLIRDPLTVDENGSITCAAEMPEGSEVRLMIGSRDEAIKVAEEAAHHAVGQLNGKEPRAVIIFNCIARNKLFGEHSRDEIAAIQRAVGAETPLIGFYTYGEQAPLGGEVRNIEKCNPAFHNETVVIIVLAD